MAKHSISEAARMVGKSRSTLHRYIKAGKLSKEVQAGGEPVIDTSELRRVYGDLMQPDAPSGQAELQPASPVKDHALEAELEALRRENEILREQRDKWEAQAERLTLLLVDQRPRQEPPRRPGILGRLFGR